MPVMGLRRICVCSNRWRRNSGSSQWVLTFAIVK
jgi:hypothetical protein